MYFEPFVGGGWVLQEMSGDRIASDGNKALIAMYQALQDGWIPPDFVSEDEYNQVKLDCDKIHQCWLFVDLVVLSQEVVRRLRTFRRERLLRCHK